MSQNRELGELAARVVVDTSGNTITVNNNLIVTQGVQANGGYGTAGQYLTSNGSATYWSTGVTTGKAIAMAIVFGG